MALTVHMDWPYYQANRQVLDAWVDAHGVDKTLVPIESRIRIEDGRVTFEQYVRGEHGILVDPVADAPRRTTVTVPLVQPWPTAALTRSGGGRGDR